MPIGPPRLPPLEPDHFGVDQRGLSEPRAGSWEEILADPVGDPGATYDPRVWVKYDATTWRRIPRFSSADLIIGIYIKDDAGIWRFPVYSGSYPVAPVPCRIYVRT